MPGALDGATDPGANGALDGTGGTQVTPTPLPDVSAIELVEASSLGEWANAWDELTRHNAVSTPFLRSWWFEGVDTGAAHFVLVIEGDRLLGGVALERQRAILGVERYRLLSSGDLSPDLLDLVADPEALPVVASVLHDWFQAPGSRVLDLRGLVEGSALADMFPNARTTPHEVCPYEPLTSDYEDYVRARSRSRRRELRRAERDAASMGVTFREVTIDEVDDVLKEFWLLHEIRADRREIVSKRTRLDRAIRLGVRRGEAALHVAEIGGTAVAIQISLLTANRAATYQLARRTEKEYEGLGRALLYYIISQFCAQGYAEVDLLRGDEPYKGAMASHVRTLMRLMPSHGARGRALVWAITVLKAVRGLAATVLPSQAPRIHLLMNKRKVGMASS